MVINLDQVEAADSRFLRRVHPS